MAVKTVEGPPRSENSQNIVDDDRGLQHRVRAPAASIVDGDAGCIGGGADATASINITWTTSSTAGAELLNGDGVQMARIGDAVVVRRHFAARKHMRRRAAGG